MTDLEGTTRTLIDKKWSKEDIISKLVEEYLVYKELTKDQATQLALAVYEECEKSEYTGEDALVKEILNIPKANITVGEQGVGCRGVGDFFVHKLIGDLSTTSTEAYLSPKSLDDAGAVFSKMEGDEFLIISKMEGMHSRLSDFPFLAGFHVTRAGLRDVYVKGAIPISIMVDVHLGDDADVGKLFDFMAGISAVAELSKVPITAGSTLRIGGDMVIGTRITGGIAVVGLTKSLLARRDIQVGDKILMTEGAGGGTISTTAIYSGNHDALKATLNIKFLTAVKAILESEYLPQIRSMCDVTNGGLRGDLYEIIYESKTGVEISILKVEDLVDPSVLDLLTKTNVDYLGVSLDALLLFVSSEASENIINLVQEVGVKISDIGNVTDSNQVIFKSKSGESTVMPRFRESAYTPIKKIIGEDDPEKKSEMEDKIEESAASSLKKREKIINYIKNNQ
ncbi:MAG: AIR synthase-related protein [Promethearchaeota archaeon]